MRIMAHRGASGVCPENTMAAFERAIEMGADSIETDVQMTKDGHLVCIHDETVDRTTSGSGWIRDMYLDDLKKLDAGSWFHSSFKQERIPTLEELLDLSVRHNIYLNIELKNSTVRYEGMEQLVADMIRRRNYSSQVIISSFNHESLKMMKSVAPEIDTGVLYHRNIQYPWLYACQLSANALHPSKALVNDELVRSASSFHIKVHPWTINDAKTMEKHIRMNVHAIITDHPDQLKKLVKKL
ncbi:glycerophosphodiester phosphodiesterase [Marinicrinis lubricantis]|uniref:Glycerophosphodiester phosphodiesterase n=1 Tax=Marinicrinis lubricantis TaxID=2086470 RepID=A0ABW1IT53_9BACL